MNQLPSLEVCLSPALLHLYDTKGKIVVVIDVFRATSTIVAALDNGAKKVIPVSSVEDCIAMKGQYNNCITAGERDGKVASGLEYGNSPLEYPNSFVGGKTLALTTTNGTRLLHMIQEAYAVITGAFLNYSAVCDYLIQQKKDVILACASWKDRINLEDSLFAGMVTENIRSHFNVTCDSARITTDMAIYAKQYDSVLSYLKDSNHYRRLSGFGLMEDLIYCSTLDLHPIVPIYNGFALIRISDAISATSI